MDGRHPPKRLISARKPVLTALACAALALLPATAAMSAPSKPAGGPPPAWSGLGSSGVAPAASDELIVGFHHGAAANAERAAVADSGAVIVERLDSIDAAVVSAGAGRTLEEVAGGLRQAGAVRYVEPNYTATLLQTPNDPSFGQLWGLHNSGQTGGTTDADVDAPEAWDTATDADLTVAITDTGVDYNHSDLAGNAWTNPGEVPANGIDDDGNGYVDDVRGYDFHNNDSDPMDDHGHGTHVAGTIGAVGNNGVGVAGVAWNTKLMAGKFLSAGGWGSYANAVRSIDYATDNGAKVINASWGGGGYSQALYDSIQRAGQQGVVFMAAAGNSGMNTDSYPLYPAAFDLDNIVSVAASTASETLAYFSNYSSTRVDLAAPGLGIQSTLPNNSYASWSGTSMATPHVAGAAALYRARFPQDGPSAVRQELIATADQKAAYLHKTVSAGRLNVDRLLRQDESPPPDPPPEAPCSSSPGSAAATSTSPSAAARQLLVGFTDDASARRERRAVDRAGAEIDERLGEIDAAVVEIDAGESRKAVERRLERSSAVTYAEPNYRLESLRTPNDPYFSQLWGLNNTGSPYGRRDADIDAPEAWDQVTSAGDVVVAITDTGVDYNHGDLESNIWSNPAEIADNCVDDDGNGYVDDVHGYDFFNDDADPMDDNSHGTHVAGTIGGVGNNGIGVAGVAWQAKLMPVKFLSGGGYGYLSDAVKSIDYATDNGAKVINASWGGGGYSQAIYDSIERAGQQGVLFVAAAGNSGRNADYYPMYPAAYSLSNIVSVAASNRYENLAYFSNYGRTRVDLAAPGQSIRSTVPNDRYATYSGTSMASPHVAGAAAIYRARHPGDSPSAVRQKLIDTADDKSAYQGKTVSGGRLNLPKLLGITFDEPCSYSTNSPPTPPSSAANQLLVGFADDASARSERGAVDRAGAEISERLGEVDVAVVEVDPGESRSDVEQRLERSAAVEYAEPNYRVKSLRTPNDSYFSRLWGLHNSTNDADIDAPAAWNQATSSGSVVVAITDTGVDYNHRDLAGNIWSNPGEVADNCVDDDGNGYVDDVHGYDFRNRDPDPMDDNRHGTHVAGTIGGVGNNGAGVTGVAWQTKLMPMKFLSGYGGGSLSDAVKSIDYAVDNGAKVINASWGGGGFSWTLYNSIRRAGERGVLFVAAAGNSGRNADYYPMYPAAYNLSNIVSVAASTRRETLAYFSNYGRRKVDLAAPGLSIWSTTPGNSYTSLSGTSMASPHVAGAAALYRARYPQDEPSAVRAVLIATADDKAAYRSKTVSNGRLNVDRLLRRDTTGSSPKRPPARKPSKPVNRPARGPFRRFRPFTPRASARLRIRKGRTKRRVKFRWGGVPGAKKYQLYINGKRRRVLRRKGARKSQRPRNKAFVRLGRGTYSWYVRAVDRRGRSATTRWARTRTQNPTFRVVKRRRR